MNPAAMSLAWHMVRHRFATFAGTWFAVALGVALIAGAGSLWASSRPVAPERLNAAPVVVHSPVVGQGSDGYDDYRSWTPAEATALAAKLGQLPGVKDAVPDPAFYAQRTIGGRATGDKDSSRTAGHAWSSATLGGYGLTAGRAPAGRGEVATAEKPGSSITVLTAMGPETWTVTGTVDGPGFYVADGEAAERAGGVRVLGLTVTGEPDAVATAAREAAGADGLVLAGSDRNRLEDESLTRIRWIGAQLIIAMLVLGAFVAVFVVASTCALSAAQRRREIGLLRAVGATPGQVRRLMYAETAVVAVLGGLAGVPAGALIAPLLARPMVATGLEPAGFTVTLQPAVLAAAFAVGLVVALLGVASAARRSSRVPALDALRDAAVERRAMTWPRRLIGGLTGLAGTALTVALPALPLMTQTTAALGAALMLLVAAALLAPVVIVPLVRLVTRPWRDTATGMLVREGTLTGVRRVASTAAPVLLTLGFAVLLTGSIATIDESTGVRETAKLPATRVAVPDGTPGLSEAAVARQPGDAPLSSEVVMTINGRAAAYEATGAAGTKGVLLSKEIAHRPAAVDVTFADGTTVRLPVTGTQAGPDELVTLPRDQVREHDPDALTERVLLEGDPVPAVGLRVLPVREYVRELIDEEGELVDVFLLVLITLTVGWTSLAVANTLLMATAARRDEFRALRLAGGGTGQALRVAGAEALLAVLVGTLLGGGVALGSLLGMRRAVSHEIGRPVDLVVPWGQATVVVLLCATVAVLAASAPILRTRTDRAV